MITHCTNCGALLPLGHQANEIDLCEKCLDAIVADYESAYCDDDAPQLNVFDQNKEPEPYKEF